MTQEEKAKAYDEAVKKIQPLYEQAKKDDNPIWSTYEYLFPELRESEDERIRKELIVALKQLDSEKSPVDTYHYQEWIAWLEKQKEQKSRKFKLGDKVHWHDDNTNVITITGFRDDAYLTDSAYGPILYSDEDNWERVEQKSADGKEYSSPECGTTAGVWSEEDEGLIDLAVAAIEDFYDESNPIRSKIINLLKSLRPQSQHRDTYYDIIHSILAMLKGIDFMQITPEHRVSLLNDIRVRCKHADEWADILDEPQWKPSEDEERLINTSISFLKDFADKGYENAVECIDWLKSKLK